MGGIHLVEPALVETGCPSTEKRPVHPATKGRVTIMTLEMLEELVKDEAFEIRLTEDEISDRSKGDGLSKFIIILQSSWFIMQCIARHVQGLDLTQLELTTLAMASLNAITFILWWEKPLGAQGNVYVHLNRQLTDKERNVAGVSVFSPFNIILTPSLSDLSGSRVPS